MSISSTNIPSGTAQNWTCERCGSYIFGGTYHVCTGRAAYQPKPHVCPVCTGEGEVPDLAAAADIKKQCPACKGACVLWG